MKKFFKIFWILFQIFCYKALSALALDVEQVGGNSDGGDGGQTPDTPLNELTAQLKEAMPFLLKAKDFITESQTKRDEEVKKVAEELKNIQGNVLDMGKKVVEIGKRRITVQPTGLSHEEKMDFAKYIIGIHKMSKGQDMDGKHMASVKEILEKYQGKAALEEGTEAEGGYLVPELFRDQIWRVAEQASIALRDGQQIPLTTGYKLPVLSVASGVSVSWVDEEDDSVESEPTFGKATVDAKKMLAHSIISNELLEDEEVGLVDFLVTLFGEAMGAEIDAQAFDGSGSPFTGVLRTSGVHSTVMATTSILNLDWDNMSDADSKIKPSVKAMAKWYMHRTILNVLRKVKDQNDMYIWQPPAGDKPATLWDYPYEIVEAMPSTSDDAANKAFLYLGNMKYYLIGTKGPMTVMVSDVLKMLNDQTTMVFRRRIAMVAALAAAFSVIKTAAS